MGKEIKEKIGKMNNEEAIEELMKFKGIGRWTAELILITTLGRMDLCVPDDLGARKAVSHFTLTENFNLEMRLGNSRKGGVSSRDG